MNKKSVLLVFVLIVLLGGFLYIKRSGKTTTNITKAGLGNAFSEDINPSQDSDILNNNTAEITQKSAQLESPFLEVTMPYLINRKYQSNILSINKSSENASYTTYFATYDSDGLKVNGLLTVPKGQAPANGWPAVVFVHGYIAPSIYKTNSNYVAYTDSIARNGFVVYKIDLRGHDKSEGEPGGAYYSSDYVIDTLNARSALQNGKTTTLTQNIVNVDPNRVGLWGHSMAGNVIFRAIAAKKDIPAAVIWAGAGYSYTDLQKYRINDNSYRPPNTNSTTQRRRTQLFEKFGQYDINHEFWKQIPATNYLDGVKTKIHIDHAVDDAVVDIGYSRDLMKILDNTTIEHELIEYPNGGHNITSPNYTKAMQNTVNFYKKNL